MSKGRVVHSLFSNPDQTWHNNLRRSVGASFTVNATAKYEPLIDSTISAFLNQLDERFAGTRSQDGIFDLHTWLSYFAFDVMSDLTYSARHGFLEQGKDMFGIIAYVKSYTTFGYIVPCPVVPLPSFVIDNIIRVLVADVWCFSIGRADADAWSVLKA